VLGAAGDSPKAKFILRAPLANFLSILRGEIDPMQAMLTRKLIVDGDMVYMMRNVPVVLDFVRCAKTVGIAS
jgi:putative sterol carrier protein